MPHYLVEMQGVAREVYAIDACSGADALERWHEGALVVSEASDMEPVSAREDS